jgi:hypothetical protein
MLRQTLPPQRTPSVISKLRGDWILKTDYWFAHNCRILPYFQKLNLQTSRKPTRS